MTHLIIGYGQIGNSIEKVLEGKVYHQDKEQLPIDVEIDVAHVCFGWQKGFVRQVESYCMWYPLVIVHSTVPMGTMASVGWNNLVYSPCRGKHPNLVSGLRTFPKYFAGPKSKEAMECFKGVKCVKAKCYEDLEMAKLLDTTYYGWNITYMKQVKKLCDEYNLDFDMVYTKWNKTYNEGYTKLGLKNVVRPVLKFTEGPTGGHCVIPNCKILKNQFKPAKYILDND